MKKPLIIGGAVALVIAAFVAGALLGPQLQRATGLGGGAMAAGPGGAGGPMANLTEEQRADMENMSAEERQAFFQEQMGGQAPEGGGPRGGDAMSIEGEVLELESDTMTVKTAQGGSQNVYLGAETVIAYPKGAEQADLAQGSSVIVLATPEGDNVLSATAVIVR